MQNAFIYILSLGLNYKPAFVEFGRKMLPTFERRAKSVAFAAPFNICCGLSVLFCVIFSLGLIAPFSLAALYSFALCFVCFRSIFLLA